MQPLLFRVPVLVHASFLPEQIYVLVLNFLAHSDQLFSVHILLGREPDLNQSSASDGSINDVIAIVYLRFCVLGPAHAIASQESQVSYVSVFVSEHGDVARPS